MTRTEIRSAFTLVDGLRVHYLAAGAGSPIVLLHGDGESAYDWTWIMPELALYYRVVAPDFPGSGRSAKPALSYAPEFFATFTRRFLNALELEAVHLMGNSLGGLAAILFALQHENQLLSLTLVDSAGLGTYVSPSLTAQALPGVAESLMLWSKSPLGAMQLAWLRAWQLFARPLHVPRSWIDEQVRLFRTPGALAANVQALRADASFMGQRVIVLDRLPALSVPVQIVWGREDLILPVEQGRQAVQRLRHGGLCEIPAAGHVPMVEQPESFLEVVLPFLRQNDLQREERMAKIAVASSPEMQVPSL